MDWHYFLKNKWALCLLNNINAANAIDDFSFYENFNSKIKIKVFLF